MVPLASTPVTGVAKAMLARPITRSMGSDFKRIQCTPNFLQSEITGASKGESSVPRGKLLKMV